MNKYLQLIDKIKQFQKIICVRHINPDGDAYGSTMGLAQFIKDNFPEKKVLIDGANVSYLDFLGQNNKLNKIDYVDALVIIMDTSVTDRIDSEFWSEGKEIIKIDHHIKTNLNTEDFADFEIIEEDAVSNCEIITKIILASKLKLSAQTARFLYTGLVTDSGRFKYVGVNANTFNLASKLLETGIDISEIYHNLYARNFNSLQLQAYCISKIKISPHGVGYILINKNEFTKNPNLKLENLKNNINIMCDVKEIKIWFMAIEIVELKEIKISLRSSKYIVSDVANLYNGGGHKLAAGCKVLDWSQINNLITDLEKVIIKKITI